MKFFDISSQIFNFFHLLQTNFPRLPSFDIAVTHFQDLRQDPLACIVNIKRLVFSLRLSGDSELRVAAVTGYFGNAFFTALLVQEPLSVFGVFLRFFEGLVNECFFH